MFEKSKKTNLSQETKSGIVVIVLIVLVVLVFMFWVMPQYANLRSSLNANEGLENELNSTEQDLVQVKNLSEAVKNISEEDKEKLAKALPEGEDIEELLATMNKLAQQSGLLITNLDVKPLNLDPKDENYIEGVGISQVNTVLKGSYPQLLSFLGLLEKNVRLIDVLDIKVQTASLGGAAINSQYLQINLTGNVYYLEKLTADSSLPYGTTINEILLESEEFKSLQTTITPIPTGGQGQIDPFAN